ncbi:twin-arginine translocase subunit TatC [Egibacter rhizosphaerae]|uniref:Sec-independent protein translocase protein TatC n=1 Tax=Egibacter rhizosphaerae TaxID=1670831 RepID=A0A411YKG8_9ACTN|nr:twin-arginine translocase subunit TatC [Egibacter rhizosphaerae]QBI21714.1 twin-arginine translocase subunit TatC [Egibacter rhizosphaerae]
MTATSPGPEATGDDQPRGGEMSLLDHLRELRQRLVKSLAAIGVGFVVGFVFREFVLDVLSRPYCDLPDEVRAGPSAVGDGAECALVVLAPLDGLMISIKAAAIVAVLIAAPVVSYQIWRFVMPGLRPVEKKYAIPFLLGSFVLFAGGAVFAYLVIPRGLALLLSFAGEGLVPLLGAHEYINFILFTVIAFGVSFEFPLILLALILTGAVGSAGLKKYRRHAIFGTFVASAIITPTGDPFTMSAMAVPLIAFFEGCVLIARFRERRRARQGLPT